MHHRMQANSARVGVGCVVCSAASAHVGASTRDRSSHPPFSPITHLPFLLIIMIIIITINMCTSIVMYLFSRFPRLRHVGRRDQANQARNLFSTGPRAGRAGRGRTIVSVYVYIYV